MLKRFITLYFAILSSFSNGQETFPVNGVATEFKPFYAFINAHIVNAENEIKNGILLIQDGKILEADTAIEIPRSAIIYDLNGDYIYPSFIDLNSNYGLPKLSERESSYRPQYESKKIGAFHWNQAIHPEIIAVDNFQNNSKTAKDFRSIGFGTVLTHQKNGIARGTGGLVLLSNKKEHQNILIKNASAHYSFSKGNSSQKYPTSLMGSIALLKQTYLDADWYRQGVEDFNYSYEAFNSQQDLPQIFEITDAYDISRVFKIADEFEIDYILKGSGDEYKQIKSIKETNFSFILPLSFPNSYDISNPEFSKNITLEQLKHWELAPFNPIILAQNGISFCFTSSDLKKRSNFLKNLRKSVSHGLDKSLALAALTTVPASYLNIQKDLGTIEKGKIANFIICSKDIFEDGIIYENWVAGKKYIINEKQKLDIRGYYTFNSDEYKNSFVAIEGAKSKVKTIFYFLDSLIMPTSIDDNSISISSTDATFRSVGKINGKKIVGRYQDGEGSFHHFEMQRDSVFKEDEKKSSLTRDTITPSIWTPNKAYGFIESPKTDIILFKNATIWTNEIDGILENADIAIKNGEIIGIGTDLESSKIFGKEDLVTSINAVGKHITCGIIDEHSHIAITRGVNEGSQAVTAEVRIGDVINPTDINIYRQLSGGVTTAQLLHGSANPIGGQSALIKMRWGSNAEEMKIEGADGFIKFALGENVKQSNWGDFNKVRFPQSRMGVEQVFFDAFYRARKYKAEWDLYNAMPISMKRKSQSPREDLELNALVEILNSERFVTCHSYVQSEINMLMHVADSMHFNINTFTHILEGYKVAEKMKNHGAGGSTFSDWWAYKFEVNDAIPYNATLMHNAGIVTAINSDDAEMGRRLNQEAAKAVKYGGSSEEDAWKMVTLNPAKLLHLDDKIGSLKVKKDADLVIWNKNPLSIYAKVEQTYIDGICLFDITRDLELRKKNLSERMRIIQKMGNEDNGEKQKPKKNQEKLYHCETLEP